MFTFGGRYISLFLSIDAKKLNIYFIDDVFKSEIYFVCHPVVTVTIQSCCILGKRKMLLYFSSTLAIGVK